MKKKLLTTLVLLLSLSHVIAQKAITGTVTFQNKSMEGVIVTSKFTGASAMTDKDGKFTIDIFSDSTFLMIDAIYFNQFEVFVGDESTVDIELKESDMIVDAKASPIKEPEKNYATVRVFFATDRNLTTNTNPVEKFGSKRSQMKYGICEVSIPRDHKMGELEEAAIWKFELNNDPEKHVTLLKVDVKQKTVFFNELKKRTNESPEKKAFIFVHGYNVSFEDASRRTAQMSYDLGFNGAPVFYSWPSQASILGYNVDEGNIEWSQANLKAFLLDFLSQSDAENIYLIAHSMGNRGLTRALTSIIAEKPEMTKRIKEIILAAPDIDADVFKRDIAPVLIEGKKPITLYTSSNDLALVASNKFSSYPRAGQAGESMVVLTGIETIDASNVKTDFLGHSYFGDSSTILSDLFSIINKGIRANERKNLKKIIKDGLFFWVIN